MEKPGDLCYDMVIKPERMMVMKFVRFLALMLCVLLLTACGGGDVRTVARHIGRCELYSEAQISDAMDEVEIFFHAEFDGCKLLRLSYDEEQTL